MFFQEIRLHPQMKSAFMLSRLLLPVFLVFLQPLSSQEYQEEEIRETIEVRACLPRENMPSKALLVIDSTEIAALRANNMAELLAALPALHVNRRGPVESSFDLAMAGANFEQVLLLVDGVPFSNPQTGHHNTNLPFSPADIERIEIIRGGGASMYGSGAFAGVVQIILKKTATTSFSLLRGEHDLFSGGLRIGGSGTAIDWQAAGERFHTSGYHQGQEVSQFKVNGSVTVNTPDFLLSGRAGFLGKDFGARNFYGPFPSVETIRSGFLQVMAQVGSLQLSFAQQALRDEFTLDRHRPVFFFNRSDSNVSHFFLAGAKQIATASFTGGLDLRRESLESSTMGRQLRWQGALFLNSAIALDPGKGCDFGVRLQMSGGLDPFLAFYAGFHSRLGGRVLWRFGAGRTMRLPSFTELYYDSPANRGDPGLQAESAFNFDSSLVFPAGKSSWELTFFHRRYHNLLDWLSTTKGASWQAVNLPRQNLCGLQADYRKSFRTGLMMVSMERILIGDGHEGHCSKYGLRFPDISFKGYFSNDFGPLNLAIRFNRRRLHGNHSWDNLLHLALRFGRGPLAVTVHADNLLNSVVEELPGLRTSGRWFSISITGLLGTARTNQGQN